mmetsp:Transcript_35717/g.72790  ORF Transcript_35717/g.72790 Transcript_35717/m.72790 type:complete len:254 (+) Transcript_35717:877-1638(+)
MGPEHGRDPGAAAHAHALRLEVRCGVVRERFLERTQDSGRRFKERDAHFGRDPRKEAGDVRTHKIVELSRQFDSRGAAPNHNEVQQFLNGLRAGGPANGLKRGSFLQAPEQALLEHGGVIKLLEEESVLLHSRNAESRRPRAHRDHQFAVLKLGHIGGRACRRPLPLRRFRAHFRIKVVRQLAENRAAHRVNGQSRRLHKRGVVLSTKDVPNGLNNISMVNRPHSRASKQRGIKKEWPWRDHRDVKVALPCLS